MAYSKHCIVTGAAGKHDDLITYVADRPGIFETGISRTVRRHLDNEWWWKPIHEKKYSGQRLGTGR